MPPNHPLDNPGGGGGDRPAAAPAVPVTPDDWAPGAPHPVTGDPGPPGTVAWQGNTPVDGVGQDMDVYQRTRPKATAAAPPTTPPPAPNEA